MGGGEKIDVEVRKGWRPCEKSLSQRKRAILLLLDRVIRSLRHAEARATTVNCPMSGGDPLFTRPPPKAAIRGTATGKARPLCKHLYRTSAPLDRLNLRVPAMLAKFSDFCNCARSARKISPQDCYVTRRLFCSPLGIRRWRRSENRFKEGSADFQCVV